MVKILLLSMGSLRPGVLMLPRAVPAHPPSLEPFRQFFQFRPGETPAASDTEFRIGRTGF